MTHELFAILSRSTLAASATLLVVLMLRKPIRLWLGATLAYRLWLLVPVASIAILLPPPVRPLNVAVQLAPSSVPVAPSIMAATTQALSTFDAKPWLLAIWAIGVVGALMIFMGQQRRYIKNLGALVATDNGEWRATSNVGCPALVGALRPRIVLPYDFETRYTPPERDLVRAHERTHLRRGDAQVNALVALLRCLHWFNPLFHFAASRFRFDQELACDALVIGLFPQARRCYADAMLKAQLAAELKHTRSLPAGCHWPSSHPLKERIAMLKFSVLTPRRRTIASALVIVLTFGVGYASWAVQPDQTPIANSPSGAANAGFDVSANIRLTIDGQMLDRTWSSQTHDTRNMQHDTDSNSWTIVSRPGREFELSVARDDDRWSLQSVSKPMDDGTIDFSATIRHNENIVGQPRIVAHDGTNSAIQIGDNIGAYDFKGIRVDLTLSRVPARPPEPANDSSAAFMQAAADGPPTERITYRRMRPPKYPVEAIKNHITGRVIVKVYVDEKGEPTSAEVVKIEPPTATILADAALAATMQWRFNPGMKDGVAVGGYGLLPIDFNLHNDDGTPVTEPAVPVDQRSDDQAISYRKMSPPLYPADAIAKRTTGTLYLRVQVNANGSVNDAYVDQAYPSNALVLSDAAIESVRTWQFNPAIQNGIAADSDVIVPVEFAIDGYVPPRNAEPIPTISNDVQKLATIKVMGSAQN